MILLLPVLNHDTSLQVGDPAPAPAAGEGGTADFRRDDGDGQIIKKIEEWSQFEISASCTAGFH